MSSDDKYAVPLTAAEQSLAEAERLIWALLDDNLEDDEAAKLSALMEQNPSVRSRYVECVQLHVDLSHHFSDRAAASPDAARRAQVLPNMMSSGLSADALPPVAGS